MTSPFSGNPHEDAAGVRVFFDQWSLYRKVLELDYLGHRDAYSVIAQALGGIGRPFSFLDLGAGDAQCTIAALHGLPVSCYEAVDLSPIALTLAERRAAELPCQQRFVNADFVAHVREMRETFDVIFIGLSLHHLPEADKRNFLPELRRVTAAGGRLMFYEPIRREGESRDQVMARWWEFTRRKWTGLTSDELDAVRDHVFNHDYPETRACYGAMLMEAGFHDPQVLFTDPEELYSVVEALT